MTSYRATRTILDTALCMTALLLFTSLVGCAADPDDPAAPRPVGESLHAVPEVFATPAAQMSCRDAGLLLGHQEAHAWVACPVHLGDRDPGVHRLPCAEHLDLSIVLYDTDDGRELDWISLNGEGVRALLVQGHDEANLYVYSDPVVHDAGLHAPEAHGAWDAPRDLSFCLTPRLEDDPAPDPDDPAPADPAPDAPQPVDPEPIADGEIIGALRVRTDPVAGFHYFFDWSIETYVDYPLVSLPSGAEETQQLWVEVASSEAHGDHFVEGLMYISNETDYAAEIDDVVVLVDSHLPATLDCGVTFPATLPPHQAIKCTYEARQLDGDERHVAFDVTVTPASHLSGQSFQRDFYFQRLPLDELFRDVTVSAELDGQSLIQEPCPGPGSCLFDAPATFQCPADQGQHLFQAEILETDARASTSLEVTCEAGEP